MDLVIWRTTSRKAYGARFWNKEEAILYMTYNCVMISASGFLSGRKINISARDDLKGHATPPRSPPSLGTGG